MAQGFVLRSLLVSPTSPAFSLQTTMALSIVDSKPVFERKLKDLGLHGFKQEFDNAGFTTHGELAFAFNFVPDKSDDTQFQTILCDRILGPVSQTNDQAKKPALRRLHFESYTIAMQDIQQRTLKSEDEIRPAKLPVEERAVRIAGVKGKYGGITIEGELEPSNSLIDKIHTIRVSGWGTTNPHVCVLPWAGPWENAQGIDFRFFCPDW